VVAFGAFWAEAVVVEVGAEVVEAGVGVEVAQQVPGDDQDGSADSDDGLLISGSCDASVGGCARLKQQVRALSP